MWALLIVVLAAVTAKADCSQILNACDQALEDQRVLVRDLTMQVGNYQKESELQKSLIADKDAQLSNSLRQPIVVASIAAVCIIVLEVATGHLK